MSASALLETSTETPVGIARIRRTKDPSDENWNMPVDSDHCAWRHLDGQEPVPVVRSAFGGNSWFTLEQREDQIRSALRTHPVAFKTRNGHQIILGPRDAQRGWVKTTYDGQRRLCSYDGMRKLWVPQPRERVNE